MEQKQQTEYKLIKLIDGTELVGQISVSDNDKFLRIVEPLQLKTVARPSNFGMRDDSSLSPWLPFSTDKVFSIPKERVITIASINKDLSHYYEAIKKRLEGKPIKPPLSPQEMDKILRLAEQMEQDQITEEERRRMMDELSDEELDFLNKPTPRTLH
jgi:hypothetical protein|tara:strand:+ start:1895 stop:2365 length:471 start_codon:yes stop_codon:yes gene_type:complete